MGIFSRRRKNRVRNSNRRRPLRAEPLEDRRMLTAIAAPLPCSVVLLNPTVTNVLPPDPSIQFSPQPLVSAAASGAVVHWQGHFSESVVESPSAAVSPAAPAAWLVDAVYSLNGQPVPSAAGTPSATLKLSGTATETLIPLTAAGTPLASGQIWVSSENITSSIVVSPSIQANPVANSFAFTTDTTINQKLSPLAATAGATTTLPSWIANTVTHATGMVTAPLLGAGTLSFQETIQQTLVSASASDTTVGWTIDAQFDAAGSYKEGLLPPVAATSVLAGPSGSLSLTGTLTETVSPPPGMGILTQTFSDKVTANVTFLPTLTPILVGLTAPTGLGTAPLSVVGSTGPSGPAPLLATGLRV